MKNFESFETNRWIWRVNMTLQVLLVLALVVVVNLIGMHVWKRFDLTKHRAYSLSAEARAHVEQLPAPVRVIVTLSPNTDDTYLAQAYRDVRGIIREFEFAAHDNEHGRVTVEYLDVDQNRARAQALDLADQRNLLAFESGGRRRYVPATELYVSDGQGLSEFIGERVITSALLDVSSQRRPVIYFLTGHGEMQMNDVQPGRGASRLDAELRARAFDTEELDLIARRRVPDDPDRMNLVLVLAPQTPLQASEQEMVREYLTKRAGRVIVALDPGHEHGLDDLFFDWGILTDDVLAIENDPRHSTPAGELRVTNVSAEHPITRPLVEARIPLVIGAARSVRPDPGRAQDDALQVTELFRTSSGTLHNRPSSWGEFSYRQPGPPVYDHGRDLIGPIGLATVAERRVSEKLGVNVLGGRIIVFGSGDFLANQRLGSLGNFTLLLNTVNWALDSQRLVNIPARPIERLKINLSEQQLRLSGLVIVFGPGLLVTLLGLAVYFSRRH